MIIRNLEKDAKKVNRFLVSNLKGNPKQLYDAASYLIVHGGKRLRPYLVFKSCEILKGNIKNAIPAASAVEMIHNLMILWIMMKCVTVLKQYIKNLECR